MHKIGIDIVAISRIKALQEKYGESGLGKFLNDSEIQLAKSAQSIAGFFAAKEACSKALGCGISKELSFKDMCISKDEKGAPHLSLNDEKMAYFNIQTLSLSISHDGGFAIAVVVVEFMD